jgi:hypothetical protein
LDSITEPDLLSWTNVNEVEEFVNNMKIPKSTQ